MFLMHKQNQRLAFSPRQMVRGAEDRWENSLSSGLILFSEVRKTNICLKRQHCLYLLGGVKNVVFLVNMIDRLRLPIIWYKGDLR